MDLTQTPKHQALFAMEMIDYQKKSPVLLQMEMAIKGICDEIDKGFHNFELAKLPQADDLVDLIFRRFGIRVRFNTEAGYGAAIIPFRTHNEHVLFNKDRSVDIPSHKDLLERNKFKKGTVDLKNAKVGGVFSEYVHSLYVDFDQLYEFKMTPAEILSVILHEIGHAFHAFEYAGMVQRTNRVLLDVSQEVQKAPKDRNIEVLFNNLKVINPKTDIGLAEDIATDNTVALAKKMFDYVYTTVALELDNDKYTDTSFENLADNFAVRMGYGREIVSGLDKLMDVKSLYFRTAMSHFGMFVVWISLLVDLVKIVMAGQFLQVAFLYAFGMLAVPIWLTWYFVACSGEQGRDYTYDDAFFRFKRVRDQMLEGIKRGVYNEKDAKVVLADIETIDNLIANIKDYRGPIDHLMNYLRPANFRAKNSIQRQQLLESLLFNDVFLKAYKLKAMA